nr:non-canonical non-ribosomal peptide synthetase fub8 [Quercus suber]
MREGQLYCKFNEMRILETLWSYPEITANVPFGVQSVFLSAKSSVPGALAVLEASDCKIWVKPREESTSSLVQDLLSERRMEVLDIPEVEVLLDGADSNHFPFTKTFDEADSEAFCILHTSGSTGLPKPIIWSHALIGTADAVRLLPRTEGDGGLLPWTTDWKDGDKIYSSFPMSHGAGVIMDIVMPALYRLHCVIGPVGVIPNMNLIESLADSGAIDIWSMVPSLVDELGETPDVLQKLKSSKFICASGGPVSPVSAAKVNDVIRVLNLTGTTEGLFIGNLVVDREDWLYFAFHPYSGFEFKETEPGVYEHWVHRNEHGPLFQGIFCTFPNQKEINLKDLYVKHPRKPNLWAYKGRNDDILVLSNGYKISPLDTEASITTHPAIEGCLMIGSGKSQAGLLIELKDRSTAGNELFDSIWATIEKADALSLHKGHLRRDFVTFAEAGRPFVRTDKRTIKRRATLELYSDYIDRFYSSREDECTPSTWRPVNTSSIDSIQEVIHQILLDLTPEMKNVAPDEDVFSKGLDSLLVLNAIKSIRMATGLQNRLSARHFYANPTISGLATHVARLIMAQNKSSTNGANSEENTDPIVSKTRTMMALQRSRLSPKLNSFNAVNEIFYIGMNFFIPLREGVTFLEAFKGLEDGLRHTMQLIPELDGKLMFSSKDEMGHRDRDMRVTLPPLKAPSTSSSATERLRQLRYSDLSNSFPSFEKLQAAGFSASACRDNVLLDCPGIPTLPADVLAAQANFVKGGCILAVNLHHAVFDGTGLITAMTMWAESCRFIQGDAAATHDWLDAESLNPMLPAVLHEVEGHYKPMSDVHADVWKILDMRNPAELPNEMGAMPDAEPLTEPTIIDPPADGRHYEPTTFLISSENLDKLRQETLADPECKGMTMSISDIVQAFFWRATMKARRRVATELRGETLDSGEKSIVEIPVDARPYFSSHLPSSYMCSLAIMNRADMTVEEICSPETSLARIAHVIRSAASRITPSLVHDTYTVLQTDPKIAINLAKRMHSQKMYAMMNNMMLFQPSGIEFGSKLFADKGAPLAMRLQIERFDTGLLLVILPMRHDGGVELLLGTLPEDLDMLMRDEEFCDYATHVG